jgi:hypothetical protein
MNLRSPDIVISRPASAPPSLEFTTTPFQNAFLFETGVADIRESPQYEKFYNNNPSKHLLPPPLQSSADLLSTPSQDSESPQYEKFYSKHLLPSQLQSSAEIPSTPSLDIDPSLSLPVNANSGFQICKYFLNGFCARGDTCNFMHEPTFSANLPYLPKNSLQIPGSNKKRNMKGRFSASHYENVEIKDCIGQICFICKDQQGCRYLQREIDKGGIVVSIIIFKEILPHVTELIDDPFGNYLVQKLIDTITTEQRFQILLEVRNELVNISKNIHGTRAAQKLIELIQTPEEVEIIKAAFMEHIVDLIEDLNGNHVVQKCLMKLNSTDNQFIYDGITENLVSVATLRHGCCVLQRCFDHGTLEQQHQLIEQILANASLLVEDAFGNYVLQYILDINLDYPDLAIQLVNQFEGEIFRMSKEKCSSNVIEKCMKSGNPACTQRVMRELLSISNDPTNLGAPLFPPEQQQLIVQSNLYELLQDPFGNYVLQTCLAEGAMKCPSEYVTMVQCLAPFVQKLQQNSNTNKKISQLLHFSNVSPSEQQPRPEKDRAQKTPNALNTSPTSFPNNPNYYFVPNAPYMNFVPNSSYLPNPNFAQSQFGMYNNSAVNYSKMNPNAKNKIPMPHIPPDHVGSVTLNPLHKISSYDTGDRTDPNVLNPLPQISLVYPSYDRQVRQSKSPTGAQKSNVNIPSTAVNSNTRSNNSSNISGNNTLGGSTKKKSNAANLKSSGASHV